jgi:hypothetical protein
MERDRLALGLLDRALDDQSTRLPDGVVQLPNGSVRGVL